MPRRRNDVARDLGTPKYRQRVVPGVDRDNLVPHCRACGAPINVQDCPCGEDGGWELCEKPVGGE